MKRIFSVSALFASVCMLAFTINSFSDLPIGSKIPQPDLKVKDISGKEISLNDAKKVNGLLVMFTCNTCPVVGKNQARTKEICAYALNKGIGIILLNSNEGQRNDGDSYDDMKTYAKDQAYNWYYALDKNNVLADAFGAGRTPECFLFDKSGKLVYHGAIDDNPTNPNHVNRQHLKEAINEELAGKEVSVKETRSIGCGIKRA